MNVLRKFIVLGTGVSGMTGIGIFLGINRNSKEEKYQTTASLIPVDVELNEIREKLNSYGPRMAKHGAIFNELISSLETNKKQYEELGWKVEIGNPDDNKWWNEKLNNSSSKTETITWEKFQDQCFQKIEEAEKQESEQNVVGYLINKFRNSSGRSAPSFIGDCLNIENINKQK